MCSSIQAAQQATSSERRGASLMNNNDSRRNTRSNESTSLDPQSIFKIKNVISLRRRTIYVFYFMAFLDLFAVSLFVPLLSNAMRDLGITPFMAGLIGSTYGAIQLVSSPLMGWGSDVYGQKFILTLSLLSTAAAYAIQGLAFNVSMMLAARSLAGVFKHTQTVGKSIVSELSSRDKSYVIGNFNAFGSMGFILGPTIGAHLVEMENGFTTVCLLSSAAFVLNAVLLLLLVPEPSSISQSSNDVGKPKKSESESRTLSMLISNIKNSDVHSILLLLVRFLFSFATLVFRENLALILKDKYDSNIVSSGYLTSLQGLMSALIGFTVGPMNAFIFRGSSLYMVLFMGILKASVLFTLYFSESYWLASSMVVCVSALNPFLRVGVTAVSLENHQNDIGTILGLSQTATSLARMISPTAAGIAMGFSSDGPFLVAAISAVCGVISTLIAQRFRYRKSQQHAKAE